MQPGQNLLELHDVHRSFGELQAVDHVSLSVRAGTITGLIGPNGAGKTTLFNIIAGALPADGGAIALDGARIDRLRPDQVYAAGLGRTFQIPKPFAEMSVLENVMIAPKAQLGERFWANWLRRAAVAEEERALRAKAEEIIAFTNLAAMTHEPASALSGGQMKLLELARVLMGDPKLILLDEPGAGINPTLMRVLADKIAEINARGVTFLIIEHNMDLVMRLCDPVIAMAEGRVIFEGTAAEASRDKRLLDVYLGDFAA
jgi:branched-chain amino acid transport system ATP-binding protein